MYIHKLSLALALLAAAPVAMGGGGPGLGQPLDESEIPTYARHAMPDGTGLPPGGGSAVEGEPIYAVQCAACHGATGTEGPIQPVVGPVDTYPEVRRPALAPRDDAVRLHSPGDALLHPQVPERRRGLRGDRLHPASQ